MRILQSQTCNKIMRLLILSIYLCAFTAVSAFGREIKNSIGMRFVKIPAGSFTMGSTNGDYDEKPSHKVTIKKSFYMGVYEVTNAQYEKFDPKHAKLRGKDGFSSGDNEAVVFVRWKDAVKFCKWLSKKEKTTYRLPTEAEWEYACRAGTKTAYSTGKNFPAGKGKKQTENRTAYWGKKGPRSPGGGFKVDLTVGTGVPVNAFGLYDMHGNVEEWCSDWWGPYSAAAQKDPRGRKQGMGLKVTRGGAHNQEYQHLRSANRANAAPTERNAMIGFRVVKGKAPRTALLPVVPSLYQKNVKQKITKSISRGPDPKAAYFAGPRQYVKVEADGPGDPKKNHDPAITTCPNGDILAIWYSGDENTPALLQMGSRLRVGSDTWEKASLFWDCSDRNDHAPALWTDPKTKKIFHFTGISPYAAYRRLALMMRTSKDNGITWSLPKLIGPEHGRDGKRTSDHQPTDSNFRMADGTLVCICDADEGSVLHLSNDEGKTWSEPTSSDQKILGIHGTAVELRDKNGKPDGRIMALSRNAFVLNKNKSRQMPKSISSDKGKTWTHTPMPFQRLTMGSRPTILRLKEGPILMATFIGGVKQKRKASDKWSRSWPGGSQKDAAGKRRGIAGLVASVSYDEGKTWSEARVLSPNGPPREVQSLYGRIFELSPTGSECWGYLGSTQGKDGVIHIITSWNEYAFNLKWLKTPMPAADSPVASISLKPGKAPRTVKLTGSIKIPDADYKYTWYFGDGKSAVGKKIVHTYAEPGRYVVTLIVSDSNGHWETKSKIIKI